MIKYTVESVDSFLEAMPLEMLQDHYEEAEEFTDKIDLEVDTSVYSALEAVNSLLITMATDGDKVVGYCIYYIYTLPHSKGRVIATNDTLYLHPDYRGAGTAVELIAFAEEKLEKWGPSLITLSMRPKKQFKSLAEGLGYSLHEVSYCKYVGKR